MLNRKIRLLYKENSPPEALREKYGLLGAYILHNRGLSAPYGRDIENVKLKNFSEAVELIDWALKKQLPVFIFGDYDADGITSSAIFYRLLKDLGFKKVYALLPERDWGYGINKKVVDIFHKVKNDGKALLVVLDNGTKEAETLSYAEKRGFRTLVFDHHTPGDELPNTVLINPKVWGTSHEGDLSTAGLVYLFAEYLAREGLNIEPRRFVDLAAIGVVADVSPVSPLTAAVIKRGLDRLNSGETSFGGLKLLLKDFEGGTINENDIGFKIAPTLNVFGRLGKANRALEFLLSESAPKLVKLYGEVKKLNVLRKRYTEYHLRRILRNLRGDFPRFLIYYDRSIPKGLLGLLAGRITNLLNIPSLILTGEDKLVGSLRSPEGLNVVELLKKRSELLERWGGHSRAAGLSVKRENLEALREFLLSEIKHLRWEPAELRVDFPLEPLRLRKNPKLSRLLFELGPYGNGNPYPVFLFKDKLTAVRPNRFGFTLLFEKNGRMFFPTKGDSVILKGREGKEVWVIYEVRNPLKNDTVVLEILTCS